jgi:hypothetical protein
MRAFVTVMVLGCLVLSPQFARAEEEAAAGTETPAAETETPAAGEKDPWKAPAASKAEAQPASNSIVVAPDPYPKAELNRPLVLRPLVLEPRLWFFFDAYTKNIDNYVGMGLGAGFGIIDNLEAGISFPVSFAPKFRPGEFGIYGAYELSSLLGVDGLFLGARLDMLIQTSQTYTYLCGADFGMLISTPFKYKFHDMVGMTAKLDIGFAARKPSYFLLGFEVGGMFQPIDWVVIELLFGLDGWMGDFSFLRIPLTLRSAFTPIADLDLFVEFGMPDLNFKNHQGISGDAFWIQIIVGAAYRFGF